MSSRILKRSFSRKPFHCLGPRQKRRILNEVSKNLKRNKTAIVANDGTVQDISTTASSFTHNFNVEPSREDSASFLNIQNSETFLTFKDMPGTSSSIPSRDDTARNSVGAASEPSFRDRLASCFVKYNVSHALGNNLLKLLRTHSCFHSSLPKDVRTLVGTPRVSAITYDVLPVPTPLMLHSGTDQLARMLNSVREEAEHPYPPSQPPPNPPPTHSSPYHSPDYFPDHSYAQLSPVPSPPPPPVGHPPPTLPSLPAMSEHVGQVEILHAIREVQKRLEKVEKNQVDYQTESQRNQEAMMDKLEGQHRAMLYEQQGEPPRFLPLDTPEEVESFEKCSIEDYNSVVVYFAQLGGYTLREMIHSCFKLALTEKCADALSWLGAYGKTSLCDKQITSAIYEATLRNRSFSRPNERDFEKIIKMELKSAKERHRKNETAQGRRIPSTSTTTSTCVSYRRNCWRNTAISSNDDATESLANSPTS